MALDFQFPPVIKHPDRAAPENLDTFLRERRIARGQVIQTAQRPVGELDLHTDAVGRTRQPRRADRNRLRIGQELQQVDKMTDLPNDPPEIGRAHV